MLVTLGWLSLGVLAVSASALSTRQDATAPKSSLLTLPLFHYEDGSGFDQYSGGSYFGVNVTVGTPPKEITLALTLEQEGLTIVPTSVYNVTLSNADGDTWVPLTPWFAFDNTSSSSFEFGPNTTTYESFHYVTRETYSVNAARETVVIGGATVPNMSIELLANAANNSARALHTALPAGGILGMGLSAISSRIFKPEQSHNGWIRAAVGGEGTTNQWPNTSFALALDRNPANNSGVMILGGDDDSLYDGELTETPIEYDSWMWVIPLGGIKVDGIAVSGLDKANPQWLPSMTDTPLNALLDPTFGHVEWPPSAVDAVLRTVPGSKQAADTHDTPGVWTVPCDTTSAMVMTLGGVDYPIDTKTWVMADKDDKRGNCETRFRAWDDPQTSPQVDAWPLGPLMRNLYASYVLTDESAVVRLARAVGGPVNETKPEVQQVEDPNHWASESGASCARACSLLLVVAGVAAAVVM